MSGVVVGWEQQTADTTGKKAVVSTGPSGLVLGTGSSGDVTVRLFRPQPTRMLLAVPEYLTWTVIWRSVALGAHVSVLSDDHRQWKTLALAITKCGGTIDLLSGQGPLPAGGRPYRPSLVVDDSLAFDGLQAGLGPWQAVLTITDAASPQAIHSLRNSDLALLSPCGPKVVENLKRAYALTPAQLRVAANLDASDAVLAMPRRAIKLSAPPTQTEYSVLFTG